MSLAGRVALVTGGNRGLGRAISMGLAEDGADVAVNYRRDAESAAETVAAIEALGRKAIAFQASIDDYEQDVALVDKVLAAFGHIDILVNNGGISSRGNIVAETEPAELERVLRVHAFAPHHLSSLVIPSMRERPRGDIVMISSAATRRFEPSGGPYNMGKAAMEALAITLAQEERRHNIHVNVVAPGVADTTMGLKLMQATAGVETLDEIAHRMPFKHFCTPEEVAHVVRFLVSEGAAYITGERIYVDGLAGALYSEEKLRREKLS